MKDVIVFISSDIDFDLRGKITNFLLRDNIQLTYNIDEANVVITKENLEQAFDNILPKPFELRPVYPMEMPIIQKTKIKHFVKKNIDIKRFNKMKQYNKIRIMNKTRHK